MTSVAAGILDFDYDSSSSHIAPPSSRPCLPPPEQPEPILVAASAWARVGAGAKVVDEQAECFRTAEAIPREFANVRGGFVTVARAMLAAEEVAIVGFAGAGFEETKTRTGSDAGIEPESAEALEVAPVRVGLGGTMIAGLCVEAARSGLARMTEVNLEDLAPSLFHLQTKRRSMPETRSPHLRIPYPLPVTTVPKAGPSLPGDPPVMAGRMRHIVHPVRNRAPLVPRLDGSSSSFAAHSSFVRPKISSSPPHSPYHSAYFRPTLGYLRFPPARDQTAYRYTAACSACSANPRTPARGVRLVDVPPPEVAMVGVEVVLAALAQRRGSTGSVGASGGGS